VQAGSNRRGRNRNLVEGPVECCPTCVHATCRFRPVQKTVWLFDQVLEKRQQDLWWQGYDPRAFADGTKCVLPPGFTETVVHWLANPEQIGLIRNATCSCPPLDSVGIRAIGGPSRLLRPLDILVNDSPITIADSPAKKNLIERKLPRLGPNSDQ
jgi:hypothetical protein